MCVCEGGSEMPADIETGPEGHCACFFFAINICDRICEN